MLDQLVAELAEAKARPVVAKTRPGDGAKHDVGESRAVAVAALEAEVDGPADDEAGKVGLGIHRRGKNFGENVQGRERGGITHHLQVDEFLNGPASELRPDTIVFAPRFILRRMRGPVDTKVPKEIETHGDGARVLSERRVEIGTQAHDRGSLNGTDGTGRKRVESLLCG